jgi:rhomboid-like protein
VPTLIPISFSSWTLVTSTFSHAQPGHALLNGLTFWFLAPTALAVLGNAQFLVLYLGSARPFCSLPAKPTRLTPGIIQPFSGGAFSSLSSLVWNKERNYHSHGASGAQFSLFSLLVENLNFLANLRVPRRHLIPPHNGHGTGAIYALASFFAFAAPRARFLLFFVVPMPAWACIGAIACFDVYNAFTRRVSPRFPFFCCFGRSTTHRPSYSLKPISCSSLPWTRQDTSAG